MRTTELVPALRIWSVVVVFYVVIVVVVVVVLSLSIIPHFVIYYSGS